MIRTSSSLPLRLVTCGAISLLAVACTNVPKYKKTSGKYDEWKSYEGSHFQPSSGTVTAVDLKANTITLGAGKDPKVLTVTPTTRVMHDATDVPLAQVPLNTEIKYTMTSDGTRLLTVWFGHRLNANVHHAPAKKDQNTFF